MTDGQGPPGPGWLPRPDERRHLALLYCDEGRNLAEALVLARLDLEGRRDVGAFATLAWALHKNGKHAEAADRYASLADEWRNHGFVLEEALAHLGEARCAAAMGERERAAAAAREARRQFVHLGVTSLADEAAAIARLT